MGGSSSHWVFGRFAVEEARDRYIDIPLRALEYRYRIRCRLVGNSGVLLKRGLLVGCERCDVRIRHVGSATNFIFGREVRLCKIISQRGRVIYIIGKDCEMTVGRRVKVLVYVLLGLCCDDVAMVGAFPPTNRGTRVRLTLETPAVATEHYQSWGTLAIP